MGLGSRKFIGEGEVSARRIRSIDTCDMLRRLLIVRFSNLFLVVHGSDPQLSPKLFILDQLVLKYSASRYQVGENGGSHRTAR
jgi:hypothetical protein